MEATEPDTVTVPRALLEALVDRVDALEERLDASASAGPAPAVDAVAAAEPPEAPASDGRVGRRRALMGLAGAAGAAVAFGATAQPAAAGGNGTAVVLGQVDNAPTSATGIGVQGTSALYGLGVTDQNAGSIPVRPAILAHAKGSNFNAAVFAKAETGQVGVRADAVSGSAIVGNAVLGAGGSFRNTGDNAAACYAEATGLDSKAVAAAGDIQLYLIPNENTLVPPDQYRPSYPGFLKWTDDGLWACVVAGTPGTWRRIATDTTAGALSVLPTPARVYDSRPGTQPTGIGPKTRFAANETRTFDLTANGSGVPYRATAALVTLLLVNAANANGNLTIWANGLAKPASNTLVWGGSAGRFTATAVTAVDSLGNVKVNASAPTDLVIDVVGYYR